MITKISLMDYLQNKKRDKFGSITLKYGENANDKMVSDLWYKMFQEKWDIKFNPEIRNNLTDNEVVQKQEEIDQKFKLLFENTFIEIPNIT